MPELSRTPPDGHARWVFARPDDCDADHCVVIRQRIKIKGDEVRTVAVHMHLDYGKGEPDIALSPYDLVRHAMSAVSGEIHQRERILSLDDPCGCADEFGFDEHTNRDHERTSCGGPGGREPCGGCYDCMIAQYHHAERKRAEAPPPIPGQEATLNWPEQVEENDANHSPT